VRIYSNPLHPFRRSDPNTPLPWLPVSYISNIACADVNNDGYDDIIIANSFDSQNPQLREWKVYAGPNLSPITYFDPDKPRVSIVPDGDMAAGDLDGDGFAEIVVVSLGEATVYSAMGKSPPPAFRSPGPLSRHHRRRTGTSVT